jgi:hypothetical protein
MLASTMTSLSQISRSLARVAHTHYPAFLFGVPLKQGEVPAFIYHDIDMNSFEADLYFLHDNGYRTLTTDEYVESIGKKKDGRMVLLTFDDAGQNFFEIALPLLEKFAAKATVFAPTFWVGRDIPGERSDDRINRGGEFMTWEQLRICKKTGLVDVQSHAHRHALVHVTDKIVDFASPKLLQKHHFYDWPMRWSDGGDILGPPPVGTPIFSSQPLLSASHRVLEDFDITRRCQEFVESKGGGLFFANKRWRSDLDRIYRTARRQSSGFVRVEHQEFEALVESEFTLTQRSFEAQMGERARYLAFPWMLGSTLSLKLAAEWGIQVVFGVGLDFRRARKLKSYCPAFGRIKGDWLRFLPGRGRLNISEVVPNKIRDLVKGQHLAH